MISEQQGRTPKRILLQVIQSGRLLLKLWAIAHRSMCKFPEHASSIGGRALEISAFEKQPKCSFANKGPQKDPKIRQSLS